MVIISVSRHHLCYDLLADPAVGPEKDEIGIEGFEEAFKDLGKYVVSRPGVHRSVLTFSRFIFQVGSELAEACQPFGSASVALIYHHCTTHYRHYSFTTPVRLFGISARISSYLSDD